MAGRTNFRSDTHYDLLICGASFAGLSVAWELKRILGHNCEGRQPKVLMVDRYAIGARQTSACAAPTDWLMALDCKSAICQTFSELVVHTPLGATRFNLPFTFSTFDYATLCETLFETAAVPFETATVKGCRRGTVVTDRGELSAKLIVDAMGWRSVLRKKGRQPPDAPLSRGLEIHPGGSSKELEIWIDRSLVPAGYSWSFPAKDEMRVGVGSFNPRFHVRQPTQALAARLELPATRYQGNWIPHKLNDAVEVEIFFVGDSAGHCLPLTAEGIRTSFYFGIASAREISKVLLGRASKRQALKRYRAFSDRHNFQYTWLLRVQKLIPKLPPRLLQLTLRIMQRQRFVNWAFGHYLKIAHPNFATLCSTQAPVADHDTKPKPRAPARQLQPTAIQLSQPSSAKVSAHLEP